MTGMTIWVRITLAAKTARVRGMAFLGVMRRATLQGRWVVRWVGGWESDHLWVKIWQDVCCCVASFSHTGSLPLHRWLSPASLQPVEPPGKQPRTRPGREDRELCWESGHSRHPICSPSEEQDCTLPSSRAQGFQVCLGEKPQSRKVGPGIKY